MTEFKPNIWLLQARADIDGLTSALGDDDPDIRRRAAVALRALGDARAVDKLRSALKEETDAQVRLDMFTSLEHLLQDHEEPAKPAAPTEKPQIIRLIEQLGSANPEEVISAINALAELRDRRAAEPLVVLFNNRRAANNVRLAAAEALLKLESAPTVVTLLAALRSNTWSTRRNAAGVLGQLRAEWAVQPLAAALKDEHPQVRRTARAALKYIETPEARQALKFAPAYEKSTTTLPKTKPLSPLTPMPAAPVPPTDTAVETAPTIEAPVSSPPTDTAVETAPTDAPAAPVPPPTSEAMANNSPTPTVEPMPTSEDSPAVISPETAPPTETPTNTAAKVVVPDTPAKKQTAKLPRTAPLNASQPVSVNDHDDAPPRST